MLFQYLTNEILALTNRSYLDRPFTPVGGAAFAPGGDSIRERVPTCRSEKSQVELAWHDLQTPALIDILPGTRPNNLFGLTFLRIIGKTAEVTINGTRAPGATYGGSALAFGESWLKK